MLKMDAGASLDVLSRQLCQLYAYTVLIFRNVQGDLLTEDVASIVTAAHLFLCNRHTWQQNTLGIDDFALFEMLHLVRGRLISWYRSASEYQASKTLGSTVRVAASSGQRRLNAKAKLKPIQAWQGMNHERSCGRFTVSPHRLLEYKDRDDGSGLTAIDPGAKSELEIDLQIMKLTVRSSHLRALDQQIAQDLDVQVAFLSLATFLPFFADEHDSICLAAVTRCNAPLWNKLAIACGCDWSA